MMDKVKMLSSLIAAAGAAGAVSLLFSYFGDGALSFGLAAFIITLVASFLLGSLPEKRRFPLLAVLFLLLAAIAIVSGGNFTESLRSLSVPFITTLKEPYDVEMEVPRLTHPASPVMAELFLLLLSCWVFLAAFLSKAASLAAGLLSFFLLLLGFYFGINPPAPALILSGAFLASLPARLKGGTLSYPEIPAFAVSLVLGLLICLAVPESRYQQPALFSRLQEDIVSFIDPYDPIFHAGNAYTGMMKGTAGHQKLGTVNGIRYSGRIIADIETADIPHRLYLRSWSGGDYGNNAWKDLPDSDYDSVKELFRDNRGEWYDQGAWLMEVIARIPALSQSLSNYLDDGSAEGLKKDFSVNAVYEKTKFFLLPYDASFGAPLFAFDRSPVSAEGKAYSTYLWNLPAGALLSMMDRESSSDPYYRTYTGAEKRYRDFVYRHYLDIPDSVKEGLAALGPVSKVTTLTEKRQRVEEIRNFLDKNYEYTTNPGKTPLGKDFITYFLTESRKGYCTSFASAAVMLLRESGIPARYAAGLTVGSDEIHEAPVSADGLHQLSINDHHAHAWAEVYVDGLGWRPVEMTPGYEGTDNPFPEPADKKKDNTGAPDAPLDPKDKDRESQSSPDEAKKNPSQQPQNRPQNNAPSQSQPPRLQQQAPSPNGEKPFPKGLLVLPLLLLAAILLLALRLTAVGRLIAAAPRGKDSFNRLLDYLDRLTRWAKIPLKGSYENRKEAYRKDGRFEGFDRLIDLLVSARYSGRPLSEDERKEAAAIAGKARKACLARLGLMERIRFRLLRKL